MSKATEDNIFMVIFSIDASSRKKLSDYIKRFYGDEGFRILQEFWKKGYIGYNVYGYINVTRKGTSYWRDLKK